MESRTRFAIGGMFTVVASVAVLSAVALTNTVALADTAGAPIEAATVRVPSPAPTATATATAVATAPQQTEAPAEVAPPVEPVTPAAAQTRETRSTETVPAPAPVVVAEQAPPVLPQPTEAIVAEAKAPGSWDAVREWAKSRGWSLERIDAWIERVADRVVLPVVPERPTGQEKSSAESGRTTAAPTTPAQHAGPDAERRSEMPGLGSKKDRSRDSPDRRD